MNNEKMNQIIDDAYKRYLIHTIMGVKNGFDRIKGYLDGCLVEFDGSYEHFSNPSFQYGYRPHTQEEFINKIKTDADFSERWDLKIEERTLSLEERLNLVSTIIGEEKIRTHEDNLARVEKLNIPTKLITVTHNNEKIEII